jgi:hypothetical protein
MSAATAPLTRGGPAPGPAPRLYCFELWVRTVMSSALVASLPVPTARTAVPREAVYSLRVGGDRDIADVVARFVEAGVQVVDIVARPRAGRRAPAA